MSQAISVFKMTARTGSCAENGPFEQHKAVGPSYYTRANTDLLRTFRFSSV